ncbi:serine/threonine protein kinase [Actinoallomurus sp. NBC_01490]|uniref:serine/threonine-protein kinase n=1 Tax=Actinoallomurus sp. NBC_01490 TaxID=2903557 RepID=UPI002E30C56C|nr:serine/threonine-protein kinase [Actinoallomurus sp. NBC_01490]
MTGDGLLPGDPHRLGDYQLIKRLGAGAMGQVFLGRSPSGLPVAVKVVHHDLAADEGFRARFARETRAARAVGGAFTAPVVDADPYGDPPWLATQFLPGLSLWEAVEEYGPMTAPAVLSLAAGLAEALRSVHEAGVVHRDLKPSNIMLTPDGPRVIDFGIAHTADADRITRAGAMIGTPGYMSPERAAGRDSGPADDVFALGCVLAYAATGHPPYGPGGPHTQLYRVAQGPPDLGAVAAPSLRSLIASCLARDPAHRPTTRDLLGRLARPPQGVAWLPDPVAAGISARAAGLPRRRLLTRLPVLITGIFLLAALVYAALLALPSGGGCDEACEHAHTSEAAFYLIWSPQIEDAAHSCAEGAAGCADQTAPVLTGLAKEIHLRTDASRYARPLADLTLLNRRLAAYRACPGCRPGATGLNSSLLALDQDLFAVSTLPSPTDGATDGTTAPHRSP